MKAEEYWEVLETRNSIDEFRGYDFMLQPGGNFVNLNAKVQNIWYLNWNYKKKWNGVGDEERKTHIPHAQFNGGENPKIIFVEISQHIYVELHSELRLVCASGEKIMHLEWDGGLGMAGPRKFCLWRRCLRRLGCDIWVSENLPIWAGLDMCVVSYKNLFYFFERLLTFSSVRHLHPYFI